MEKSLINKGIVKCLLDESNGVQKWADLLGVYEPTAGAVLAKLVFYQHSVWGEPEVPTTDLLESADIEAALNKNLLGDENNDDLRYSSKDTVLPYIVIIDPGSIENLEVGEIRHVDPSKINGYTKTDEFLKFAKAIQNDRMDSEGNPLIEAKKRNIDIEVTNLEKHWGRYRIEMPWLNLDVNEFNNYLLYELHAPHIRGRVSKEKLQKLLEDA